MYRELKGGWLLVVIDKGFSTVENTEGAGSEHHKQN